MLLVHRSFADDTDLPQPLTVSDIAEAAESIASFAASTARLSASTVAVTPAAI